VRLSPGRWAVLVAVGAIVAGIGATAFACANLATLSLSTPNGRPGTTVTFTGAGFAYPRAGSNQAPTPVVVRWRDKDGPILAEVTPNRFGSISATFTVPEATPGTYVLVATQKDARGVDAYGTPARASYQILGANGRSVVAQPGAPAATALPSESSSTGIVALTVALGVLGLALFATGFIAFLRQIREATAPAAPARRS